MSPNLYGGEKLASNVYIYEDVLHNVLKIIGHGTNQITPNDRDITVGLKICQTCQESCESSECQLCFNCLGDDEKSYIKTAYLEQLNIGEFKRVLPPPSVR